ncbi:MAG: type I-U CRISPR-associated protein Csx17 [Thermoplasmata archaeon]
MSSISLNVVHCEGITPDSLGQYLCGLGLLKVLSKNSEWNKVRGCWQNHIFAILGKDLTKEKIENYLLNNFLCTITEYRRKWKNHQKEDSNKKQDKSIWSYRNEAPDEEVEVLDAHIIGAEKLFFNPIFGTGGNIGKRDLEKPAKKAIEEIKKLTPSIKKRMLEYTLYQNGNVELPELSSTGTWFVHANERYNSGQNWSSKGYLSPWAFLLALEGALILSGGIGKRLGSVRQPYALFPFITDRPSPVSEKEMDVSEAEFWAPLWEYPATIEEVRKLFERGLARVGQRAAKAPYEFAAAALSVGVDAGVKAFCRYKIRRTTSSKTKEVVPDTIIPIHKQTEQARNKKLILEIIPWLGTLRFGEKPKYSDFIGPLEDIIIKIGKEPNNEEYWQKLLLLLADTQQRIDESTGSPKKTPPLPMLSREWFENAWPKPSPEIIIARAIASIGSGSNRRILTNIFGIEQGESGLKFKETSVSKVWHKNASLRTLKELIYRRLMDADHTDGLSILDGVIPAPPALISRFINGKLDIEQIIRWVPAFSLIDWYSLPPPEDDVELPLDGAYQLYSLLKPLFQPKGYSIKINGFELFPEPVRPGPSTARHILNLMVNNDWQRVIEFVRSRYHAAGWQIIIPPEDTKADADLMIGSLIIPMRNKDVKASIVRWLYPRKKMEE